MTRYPARLPAGTLAVAALILCAAAAILFAPVQIPSSVRIPGRMEPIREWLLTRDTYGGFTALLLDRERGTVNTSSIARFDQGDAVEFHLYPGVARNAAVGLGDTVGAIASHSLNEELVSLRGQLSVAKASLAVVLTGEKAAIVREAQNGVKQARILADEQRRIVQRQRKLFEKEFISPQAFETLESTLKRYETDVAIAEARLAAAETGAKSEEAEMIRAEIASIGNWIEALEERRERYTITSPLRGTVFRLAAGDTLVALGDDSAYLLTMPVRLRELPRIDRDRPVRVRIRGLNVLLDGRLAGTGNVVGIVQGEQVAAVTAIIRPDSVKLYPGLVADCTIPCKPMSIRERMGRALGAMFAR
jgi:hypothetical protein